MADTARELAAEHAFLACQLLEFQKLARHAPHLDHVSVGSRYTGDGVYEFVLNCYLHHTHYNRKSEQIELSQQDQIDAIRTWAHKLGSELHLDEAKPAASYDPGTTGRRLWTEARLPNGLHVEISTVLYYDAEAPEYHGRPAAPAIAAA